MGTERAKRESGEGHRQSCPPSPPHMQWGAEPQTTLFSCRHLPLPLSSSRAWNPMQCIADALGQQQEDIQGLPTMAPCSHPIPVAVWPHSCPALLLPVGGLWMAPSLLCQLRCLAPAWGP